MYRVHHIDADCQHYNDRSDRECTLETAAEWVARIHNGLIHGVDSHDAPCAYYYDTDQETVGDRDTAIAASEVNG